MAKIYGDRWETLKSLPGGGQADIFVVRDLRAQYPDELVLKRVKNPRRHDRFRNEVEAIKRLSHSNIIRLLDHSALSSDGEEPDTQFIVMPLAAEGDLSRRAGLYANNIDGVIQVAKSLAHGLQAAHAAGIVHRDVKPKNILFPAISHDVWLSDFGICLIRDQERPTGSEEVVGPVQFMAPELEGGGMLDVTPAADIYSFGKVIYYMLSGGTTLPRERLNEPEYAAIFQAGERHRLFEALLSRMICPLSRRLESIDIVVSELDRIERWEREAHLIPIQSKTLASIEALKRNALNVRLKKEANAETRSRREAARAAASTGAMDWFRAELEKTAALFQDGDAITAGVRIVEGGQNDCPPLNHFMPGQAVELWIRNKVESMQREHLLRWSICSKMQVSVHVQVGPVPSMPAPADEPEHVNLLLLPAYGRRAVPEANQWQLVTRNKQQADWQFFETSGRLHRPVANQPRSGSMPPHRRAAPMPAQQPVKIHAIPFSTADWPSIASEFAAMLQQVADTFVSAMSTQ